MIAKSLIAAAALATTMTLALPADEAKADLDVNIGIGVGVGVGAGFYPGYYPGYYPDYLRRRRLPGLQEEALQLRHRREHRRQQGLPQGEAVRLQPAALQATPPGRRARSDCRHQRQGQITKVYKA